MKHSIQLFMFLCLLAMCVPFMTACDQAPTDDPGFGVERQGETQILDYDAASGYYLQQTDLKIRADKNFRGVVLEVAYDGVAQAVEYFGIRELNWTWVIDRHYNGRDTVHVRTVKIYPADAEGVTLDKLALCYLVQNEDGSFKTDPNTGLNWDRKPKPVIGGRITRSDKSKTIELKIECNASQVIVTLDGKATTKDVI